MAAKSGISFLQNKEPRKENLGGGLEGQKTNVLTCLAVKE
jgi:hypothetical protein